MKVTAQAEQYLARLLTLAMNDSIPSLPDLLKFLLPLPDSAVGGDHDVVINRVPHSRDPLPFIIDFMYASAVAQA